MAAQTKPPAKSDTPVPVKRRYKLLKGVHSEKGKTYSSGSASDMFWSDKDLNKTMNDPYSERYVLLEGPPSAVGPPRNEDVEDDADDSQTTGAIEPPDVPE